jgi:hypothetical protein
MYIVGLCSVDLEPFHNIILIALDRLRCQMPDSVFITLKIINWLSYYYNYYDNERYGCHLSHIEMTITVRIDYRNYEIHPVVDTIRVI